MYPLFAWRRVALRWKSWCNPQNTFDVFVCCFVTRVLTLTTTNPDTDRYILLPLSSVTTHTLTSSHYILCLHSTFSHFLIIISTIFIYHIFSKFSQKLLEFNLFLYLKKYMHYTLLLYSQLTVCIILQHFYINIIN